MSKHCNNEEFRHENNDFVERIEKEIDPLTLTKEIDLIHFFTSRHAPAY
jgi:hypothetical protein